jgi:hypothetical protein
VEVVEISEIFSHYYPGVFLAFSRFVRTFGAAKRDSREKQRSLGTAKCRIFPFFVDGLPDGQVKFYDYPITPRAAWGAVEKTTPGIYPLSKNRICYVGTSQISKRRYTNS